MLAALLLLLKRALVLTMIPLAVAGYLASGLEGVRQTRPAVLGDRTGEATGDGAWPPAGQPAASLQLAQGDAGRVDQAFEDAWREAGIDVAERADWMAVCRRLSLALVGSGMSLEEIRALQALPEQRRVTQHLDQLLDDPRHHDYWAQRWTRALVGADDGPFITFRRRRFRLWLSDQIADNRPLDELIRQLITARGLPTDRPEVNYLTVTMDSGEEGQPDPVRLASRTSRVLLGLRIDCLQCHDDFLGNVSLGDADNLDGGTQSDFHSLVAFFSPARFHGLQGIRDRDHPYRYQFLDAEEQVEVKPAVPFAHQLLPAGGEPRQQLAAWLTHPENRQVAFSLSGRIWALMFGRALGQSIDDLPLDQPLHPAHQRLAEVLIDSGYDMRHLIRVIALSEVFGLASEADFEITARHEQAWSVFPLVRLRPEQVAASLIQASRVKTVNRDSSLVVQLQKIGGVNDFVKRYGDVGQDEFAEDTVTVTQRLLMLNGKLVREQTRAEPLLGATAHIRMFSRSAAATIDNAYLCVLNRYPDQHERAVFQQRLAAASGKSARDQLLEDLIWVLVNSSEFAWNH